VAENTKYAPYNWLFFDGLGILDLDLAVGE
jgi:hypothetical protein